MKKTMKNWVKFIPVMIVIFAIFVVIFLFLLKFMWAWLIPDLFPGAVAQGLIAAEISWFTAFKAAIALAIFGAMCGGSKGGSGKDEEMVCEEKPKPKTTRKKA